MKEPHPIETDLKKLNYYLLKSLAKLDISKSFVYFSIITNYYCIHLIPFSVGDVSSVSFIKFRLLILEF